MTGSGSLEYAQARLQSRHGARPGPADWGRVEALRSLSAFVAAARAGPLARWVEGLGTHPDSHRIDAQIRAHWRSLVAEVASWMPPAWGPAVRWCAVLPDLALLQHVARAGMPPPWTTADPWFERLAGFGGRHAPLAPARVEPDRIGTAWVERWRHLLPHTDGDASGSLAAFERLVRAHWRDFAQSPGDDGSALRRAFATRAALLFRRAALQPAAAFAFLALSALDLERLRGELARRAAFGELRVT